uniref:Uncharacterized protein n=1 Tax=Cyprinus carpio TaxID=7962 RepID=A0A8C2G7C6_CYPCA
EMTKYALFIVVPVVQRKLGDVRLNQLCVCILSSVFDILGCIGGIGGISMLLTGYCVLCYIWNYPHLKKERWRKYH